MSSPYFVGGWQQDVNQPDSDSKKDFSIHSLLPKLSFNGSFNVDLRKWCSPVEDQGRIGSCVANAIVSALELNKIREGKPHQDLSRLFLYYNARLTTNDQDKDQGTYIRLAMQTLSTLGTCLESSWTYDVSKVFTRPTMNSYREAYVNKINAFYRIDGTGEERNDLIKAALCGDHAVVFGTLIDDEFVHGTKSDGMVYLPTKSVRVNVGGHAMLIVGYDDSSRRFIVRNSWGKWWGDNGYCYVPYEYLDATAADDFWVPTVSI